MAPASAATQTPGSAESSGSKGPLSFQGLILRLQNYWAEQGCVILQPYDMEVGAGTFHPATTLARAWAEALARRLCPAVAPPQGRPLWREPEPAAALLPVPGDPEAVARRRAGPLSRQASTRSASIRRCTTSASSRTTGKARRWAPGALAGKSGATAWRSPSSPISSRSAASSATRSSGEMTYGLERLAMYVQGVENVYDLRLQRRGRDATATCSSGRRASIPPTISSMPTPTVLFRHFADAETECHALI